LIALKTVSKTALDGIPDRFKDNRLYGIESPSATVVVIAVQAFVRKVLIAVCHSCFEDVLDCLPYTVDEEALDRLPCRNGTACLMFSHRSIQNCL
jgi:hypothetical protein